jgi:DNA sulfur modification protein DndE
LAEPSRPPSVPIPTEGGIEIDWRTFAGRLGDLYLDLLKQRCLDDGLKPDRRTLQRQLLLHLHRGIGYLVGDPVLGKNADGSRSRRGTGVRELVGAGLSAAVPDGGGA